jgi:two-component system sensor histidine kinase MprB
VVEERDLRRQVEDDLELRAEILATDIEGSGDLDSLLHPPFGTPVVYAQVLHDDGQVQPLAPGMPPLPVDDDGLDVARGRTERDFDSPTVGGVHLRMLTVPLRDGTALQMARPVDEIDLHVVHFAGLLTGLCVVGTAVALLLGRLVARSALRPLGQLTEDAGEIASSRDLSRRITTTGDAELNGLADSLNTLVGALDEALRTQHQLVADASHELQTPLTVLRTNIGLLQRAPDLAASQRTRLLADTDAELARMSRLVTNLVDLARDATRPSEHHPVAVDEVLADVVAAAHQSYPEVRIVMDVEPHVVDADPDQVLRLARNLVDNAASWSPADGIVTVRLVGGTLTVRDEGPGIHPDEVPHIFRRFYRAPSPDLRPGSGLGLAIVQKAAVEHGWTVGVTNHPKGGAVFTVEMAQARQPGRAASARSRTGGTAAAAS